MTSGDSAEGGSADHGETASRAPGTGAAGSRGTRTAPVSVLFVCTANRIRSPFAAAVARRTAAEEGLGLRIESAGLDPGGIPAMDRMVEVASGYGVDLSDHMSREVTDELIDATDLVVAMTGSHVIDLAGTFPEAQARTVTLREAASAVTTIGAPEWEPNAVRRWAAKVTQRPLATLLGGEVDIADPVGRSRRVHKRTAAEIIEHLEQLLVPHGESDTQLS